MESRFYHNRGVLFFFIGLVLLSSGHALQVIVSWEQYLNLLGGVLLSIPIFRQLRKQRISTYLSSPYIVLLMLLTTWIFHIEDGTAPYIMFGITIFIAFGITLVYSFKQFVNCFLMIMTSTTVIALVGYILVNYTGYLSILPKMINTNGVEYGVGIIYNYITIIPKRNCGMFWEPGLFATFLILAIVFEVIFKVGKISKLRIVLFSVAIFTANSSAGYVLWIMCVVLTLVSNNKYQFCKKRMTRVISFIVFLLGLLLLTNIDYIIRYSSLSENEYLVKILSENMQNASRILAIKHNLNMFFTAPIFGMGFTNVAERMQHVADTSTSTYLLSVFGILGGIYTSYWIYGVLKIKNINIFSKITLCFIFISIINKEPHSGILFTWCLLFYLLKGTEHPYPNLCNDESVTIN